jgi:hypothetical protein
MIYHLEIKKLFSLTRKQFFKGPSYFREVSLKIFKANITNTTFFLILTGAVFDGFSDKQGHRHHR